MVSALVLEIYEISIDIKVKVHTNASAKALGAILLQKPAASKHFHPTAYYIKNLNNA